MKFHDFSTESHLYLRAQAKFCITIKSKVIYNSLENSSNIKDIKTNSIINAPLIQQNELFPLIIFSHGLGGMRMQNTISIHVNVQANSWRMEA